MATRAIEGTRVLDNYVGGRWTPASSEERLDVTNPATGETLAQVPLSGAADLDAAVAAARAALPAWRKVNVIERGRRLFALREGLDARREELRASLPIRRVVGPEDVAAAALHLMTNTALTGVIFDVDGGQKLV